MNKPTNPSVDTTARWLLDDLATLEFSELLVCVTEGFSLFRMVEGDKKEAARY
jgi:hypothetical protein